MDTKPAPVRVLNGLLLLELVLAAVAGIVVSYGLGVAAGAAVALCAVLVLLAAALSPARAS